MSDRTPITAHALLRYLERVDGHDSGVWRDGVRRTGGDATDDGEVLAFAAAYAGVDLGRAARRLLSPAVRQALACGAKGVVVAGFRYVIHGGRIVTVRPLSHGAKTGGRKALPLGWRDRRSRRAEACRE